MEKPCICNHRRGRHSPSAQGSCYDCPCVKYTLEMPCENCTPDGVYVELCKLHAAAPALLEALETVADSFGRKLDATLTTDEFEALVKVCAAIEATK